MDSRFGPKREIPEHLKEIYTDETWASLSKYQRYNLRNGRPTLAYKFGITDEQYVDILESQNSVCAICGEEWRGKGAKRKLAVDHDHETDEIRGLLCAKCNLLLGCADDNIEILENAIKYLKRYL